MDKKIEQINQLALKYGAVLINGVYMVNTFEDIITGCMAGCYLPINSERPFTRQFFNVRSYLNCFDSVNNIHIIDTDISTYAPTMILEIEYFYPMQRYLKTLVFNTVKEVDDYIRSHSQGAASFTKHGPFFPGKFKEEIIKILAR